MFPGISLTSFSEPFLITPNAPTTTGTISVFICHILVIRFPDLYTWKDFSETLVKVFFFFFIRGYSYINESAFLVVVVVLLVPLIIIIIIIIIITIIDHKVTKVERDLLGLPVCMGSHGFTDPVVTSSLIKVTNPLVRLIV